MVECQLGCLEAFAAVLTAEVVASQDTAPVELDLFARKLCKGQDPNDSRRGQIDANGADPVVVFGFDFELEGAELDPVLKIVGDVSPILDADDLGYGVLRIVAFDEEVERAAHSYDAKRGVVRVEQQDVAIQNGR